jgi:hypothetical protein
MEMREVINFPHVWAFTAALLERKTLTADASTEKRVAQSWICIRHHGVFPRALVTMKKADGLSLIDGRHRMAAFEMIQRLADAQLAEMGLDRPAQAQEVWLGTHSDGEVPAG